MNISSTIMLLAGMLIVALLLKSAAQRWRLPFPAVLLTTGFLGSELLVGGGIDLGIRYDSFYELIFFVFLPLLVFELAFKIDASLLWKNIVVIFLLAVPVLLLSMAAASVMIYFGIGHAEGFPWIAALLTGALLASTDSSPATGAFARLGVPKRLRILLEGEDLFNDAAAIVVFSIFLYIALHPAEDITVADALLRFLIVFFGGALIGLLVGIGFLFVSRLFEDHVQQAVVTLISAYSAYLAAEQWLNVSGVMAVLVTGLVMGRVIHNDFQDQRGTFVDEFWTFNVYMAEALVFLLMGMTITPEMFQERWLAMVIGIAAVLLARAAGVFGSLPLISRLPGVQPVPMSYRRVLYVGGLRGAVTLALALSLPIELPYWWTIQSIAFGVVIFTLFVHAPYMEPLIANSGLKDQEPERKPPD